MTSMLVLTLDGDLAGHLAVALRRHRTALRKRDMAEPPGLADLEAAAAEVVTSTQQASRAFTVPSVAEDDRDDRAYLTRKDVCDLTGASLSTIDRWLKSGRLPSSRHGRIRRVARVDLERFLAA